MASTRPGQFEQKKQYSRNNVAKLDRTWQLCGKATNEVYATEMELRVKEICKIDAFSSGVGEQKLDEYNKGKERDKLTGYIKALEEAEKVSREKYQVIRELIKKVKDLEEGK